MTRSDLARHLAHRIDRLALRGRPLSGLSGLLVDLLSEVQCEAPGSILASAAARLEAASDDAWARFVRSVRRELAKNSRGVW